MTTHPTPDGPPAAATAERTFDAVASSYTDLLASSTAVVGGSPEHFARRKVDVLDRLLPRAPAKVLDFGCGIGLLMEALLERYRDSEVVGVDVSAESLSQARSRLSGFGRRATTSPVVGARVDLPDAAFDLVTAACVFHHIPVDERDGWMRELARLCAPGGMVAVFEHNPWNPLTRKAVRDCPFDEGAVLLSMAESERLSRSSGLEEVRTVHYLFLPPALYGWRALERPLAWLPIGGQYATVALRPR